MQLSTFNMPIFWLSISVLISTALCGFPSLLPRHGFTVDTVHNEKHVPNGVNAKAKAMAKFAHLVDSDTVESLDYDPCE